MRWLLLLDSCASVRHALRREDLAAACRALPSLEGVRAERGADAIEAALQARIHLSTVPLSDAERTDLLGEEAVAPLDLRSLTVEVDPPLRARLVEGGVIGAEVDPQELSPMEAEEARRYLQRWAAIAVLEGSLPALPPRPEPVPLDSPVARVGHDSLMDAVGEAVIQLGILPLCILGEIFGGGGGDCRMVASGSSSYVPPQRMVAPPDPWAEVRTIRDERLTAVVDRIFAPCEPAPGVPCVGLFLAAAPGPQTVTLEIALDDPGGVCLSRVRLPLPP